MASSEKDQAVDSSEKSDKVKKVKKSSKSKTKDGDKAKKKVVKTKTSALPEGIEKPAKPGKAPKLPTAKDLLNSQVEDQLGALGSVVSTLPDAEDEEAPSTASVVQDFSSDVEEDDEAETDQAPREQKVDLLVTPYEKCTRCTHLVHHGEKEWNKCHFSKGNDLCPAQYLKIVKGLPIEATAAKLALLRLDATPDSLREINAIYTKLVEKYDPLILAKVTAMETLFVQNPSKLDAFVAASK